MSQRRLHSMVETLINMLLGFWLSVAVQAVVFPLYGFHIQVQDNIQIVAIFTLISMVRGYTLRRLFNWWSHRNEKNTSTE